ncbi:MAG: hypothetical protein VX589_14020, partial [Myxococcota bacterium]|nr:hypothetical protein [Myxococcota bacterium]
DKGDAGDEGQQGSPDTPQQVRDKLLQADGTGSNIDADLIDGISSGSFLRSDANDVATGEIRFSSAIRPSAGGGANNGIRWLDDAHGGGGDRAWIQWVSENGEDTALRIGVANETNDNIELYAPGRVLLNGPQNIALGIDFPNNQFGGDGDAAFIRYESQGGDNTRLRIQVGNDNDDNIELNASGGVDVVGSLRVNGVPVPLSDEDFLERITQVDGSGSGISADLLDGLNSNQFLRSEGNITTGGSVTMSGNLIMGDQKLFFQSDASDAAYIYEERRAANLTALVLEKRDDANNDEIRLRFQLCCGGGTRDVLVARSHDIKLDNVNFEVNDRFFMPRTGYYFKVQRPNANNEGGIQLRTGDRVSWYMWIDNNGSGSPALRFLQSGHGFDDANPQFRIEADGDAVVGRNLTVRNNLEIQGSLVVDGNDISGGVPTGAIVLHEERGDDTMANSGFQSMGLSVVVGGGANGNSWRTLAGVPRYQGWSTAAVISGRMYQMGTAGNCVYEYNLANNSWNQRACHPSGMRYSHAAYAVGEYIYYIGGHGPHNYNHRYHPASNSWNNMASIITSNGNSSGRYCARGGMVDDRSYIAQGTVQAGDARNIVRYDPANNSWWVGARASRGSREFNAGVVGNHIYFAGGNTDGRGSPSPYMERYDVRNDSWTDMPDAPESKGNMAVAGGPDGRLYYINGTSSSGLGCNDCSTRGYAFDPDSNTWSRIADSPGGGFYPGIGIIDNTLILSSGEGRGGAVHAYTFPGKKYYLYRKN